MKTCNHCGKQKEDSEFSKNPHMKHGRLNQCRVCRSVAHRNRRIANHDYYAAVEKDPKRMEMHRNRQRDYRRRNPEKAKAHLAVWKAIRTGIIKRGPCEVCDSPETEAHHDDYTKPLVVRWLCNRHHEETHHPLMTTI